MDEETLTSMEIHIQYNYSWRIRFFFFFLSFCQGTGTTNTAISLLINVCLKGTALLINIFLFQVSKIIFLLRTFIFQWEIQCHVPYN